MPKIDSLALIVQMIEAAEKNIQSAKQLLREAAGGTMPKSSTNFAEKANSLNVVEGGKIIEGVFDGQNMIGPDNKQYPVPANYASKSKLVEGDILKLTIADDGSFIYKQIGPIERIKIVGILMQDEKGDYKVIAEGKTYKVLLASLTYFKADAGDEVTIVIPEKEESEWAAVEHVIKHGDRSGVLSGADNSHLISNGMSGDEEEIEMSPLEPEIDSENNEEDYDEDFSEDSDDDSLVDQELEEVESESSVEPEVEPIIDKKPESVEEF